MNDTTRKDVQALWEILMPYAEQQLREHGSFDAFGAAMEPDGTIALTQAVGFDAPRDAIEAGFREAAHK